MSQPISRLTLRGASALALAIAALQAPAWAQSAPVVDPTPPQTAATVDPTATQVDHGTPAPAAAPAGTPPAPTGTQATDETIPGDVVVTAQRRTQRLQDVPIAVSVVGGGTLNSQNITSSRDLAVVIPGLVANQKGTSPIPYLRGIGTNVSVPGAEPPVVTYIDGQYLISPILGNSDLGDVDQIEVLKGPQGTNFGRNAVGGVINVTTRMPTAKPQIQASAEYSSFDTKEIKAYASGGTDTLAAGLAVDWHDQGDGWGRNTLLDIPAFYRKTFTIRGKVAWDPGPVKVLASAFYNTQNTDLGNFSLKPGTVALSSGKQYTNPGFYDTINNNSVGLTSGGGGGFIKVSGDLGFADLSNQTGYQRLTSTYYTEGDYTPDNRGLTVRTFTDQAITNETLLSSNGSGSVTWLAGLFLLHQKTKDISTTTGSATAGGKQSLLGTQVTNSVAPFANATWEFLPKAHLTGGVRYTIEDRKLENASVISAANVLTPYPDGDLKYKQFTFRAGVDYKAGPVLLYGSVNRGATTGFFQLPNPNLPPLNPAQLTAYEVGAKSQFFDRALTFNVAVFDYEYKNIVVTARTPSGTTSLQNGAAARTRGVDVDYTARLSPRFTLSGGLEFLDAKYRDFTAASVFATNPAGGNTQFIADVSGDTMIVAPKFSFVTSANYTVPTPIGKLLLSANYSHKSTMYFTVNDTLSQGPVDLVNLSAALTLPNDHFTIAVFAKNVGNVKYDVDGTQTVPGTSHLPGEPRIVGVRLGVSF